MGDFIITELNAVISALIQNFTELSNKVEAMMHCIRSLCRLWWKLAKAYMYAWKIPSNCSLFAEYRIRHNELWGYYKEFGLEKRHFENALLKDICDWSEIQRHLYP